MVIERIKQAVTAADFAALLDVEGETARTGRAFTAELPRTPEALERFLVQGARADQYQGNKDRIFTKRVTFFRHCGAAVWALGTYCTTCGSTVFVNPLLSVRRCYWRFRRNSALHRSPRHEENCLQLQYKVIFRNIQL